MSKYIPGQKLNSAAEVMQALLDGQYIVIGNDVIYSAIGLVDGSFKFMTGGLAGKGADPCVGSAPWYVYTPPKRKITSTRWVAITRLPGATEGVFWERSYFYSEESARKQYPRALAYHCVTVEVFVDDDSLGAAE